MKALFLAAFLILGGCAQWDSVAAGIAKYGAGAADRELEAGIWATCQAPSWGALRRKFHTTERFKAANDFCNSVLSPPEVEIE